MFVFSNFLTIWKSCLHSILKGLDLFWKSLDFNTLLVSIKQIIATKQIVVLYSIVPSPESNLLLSLKVRTLVHANSWQLAVRAVKSKSVLVYTGYVQTEGCQSA